MERGHYVTLDLHHPFPRARPARPAARRPCRAGQADARPRLPAGHRPAGRRALLQLQRHVEAHPRAQRASMIRRMTGPVRAAYDALVTAGELKPDPGAAARGRRARPARGERRPSARALLSRLFGAAREAPAGVYLWGGVGRGKSMLMDLAFDAYRHPPQAPRPFPRIHARGARSGCASCASARKATRSRRSPSRSPPRRGCSASTRWWSTIRPTR